MLKSQNLRGFFLTLGLLTVIVCQSWGESYTTNIVSGTNVVGSNPFFVGESGPFNYFEINQGGSHTTVNAVIGSGIGASNNTALVRDAGSIWRAGMAVGYDGAANSLIISNGGKVDAIAQSVTVGVGVTSTGNTLSIYGPGSILSPTILKVGSRGNDNKLIVSKGGVLNALPVAPQFTLGSSSSNNTALITDPGTTARVSRATIGGWFGSSSNVLIITNGARMDIAGFCKVGEREQTVGNSIQVSGSNTVLSFPVTGSEEILQVGREGSCNNLTVSDGARVMMTSAIIGKYLGSNNLIVNNGGFLAVTNGGFNVGLNVNRGTLCLAGGDTLLGALWMLDSTNGFLDFQYGNLETGDAFTQGGTHSLMIGKTPGKTALWTMGSKIGYGTHNIDGEIVLGPMLSSTGMICIAGSNTILRVSKSISVGGSDLYHGVGSLVITNGGTLEANVISNGWNADIHNIGGIFQFSTNQPVIANRSQFWDVGLNNGTISFRNCSDVDINTVQSLILFEGDNAFRLVDAQSKFIDYYSFSSERIGPQGYAKLVLNRGEWRGRSLTIGKGGTLQSIEGKIYVDNISLSGGSSTELITSVSTNPALICATNSSGTGRIDIRGDFYLQGDLITDNLSLANGFIESSLVFTKGSILTGLMDVSNMKQFIVGTNFGNTASILFQMGFFANGVLIAPKGIFGGSGLVHSALTNQGVLALGNYQTNLICVGNTVFAGGSKYSFTINGDGTNWNSNVLDTKGPTQLHGGLEFSLGFPYRNAITNGASVLILSSAAPISGIFTNAINGNRYNTKDGWGSFQVVYEANNVRLSNFQFLDLNKDGLPDPWQQMFFGVGATNYPTSFWDADADNDGVSNRDEFRTATSPIDKVDCLKVLTQYLNVNKEFVVQWQSVVNHTYELQTSTDLVNWSPLATVIASDDISECIDPSMTSPSTTRRFYRIKIP